MQDKQRGYFNKRDMRIFFLLL